MCDLLEFCFEICVNILKLLFRICPFVKHRNAVKFHKVISAAVDSENYKQNEMLLKLALLHM